ncbi:MAG: hypothetical protein EU551_03725 [Promethearchaeota archaeon]|nr:MAG: hypothetical protein EU551_03725 [Candidatus Lokiarchaeota archaeon]
MGSKRVKKLIKIILGIVIAVVPISSLGLIASMGTIDILAVLEFVFSPILIVILLEFAAIIIFIEGFLFSKKWRRNLWLTSLVIALSLVCFYVYIPFIPVNISPNHPDSNWWDNGSVVHILPAVSDDRMLIKTSFTTSLTNPQLNVSGLYLIPGNMTDTQGYFWSFDVRNLTANTTYQLRLLASSGLPLCDPWPLKTFPDPYSNPENLKVVAFTGSGGHDACRTWYGSGNMPLSYRQKILNRALSFGPDVLVGSGDQIYYDVRYGVSAKLMGDSRRAITYSGQFDYTKPILGTENENVLKNAVGPQIAYLYGTACRSIPTYFILDDHDYFANDDAFEEDSINIQLLLAWINPYIEACVTFPPDPFMLEAGRVAQNLYIPEFLPDDNRPLDLPSTNASDRAENVSECFGTLRYGNLVEGLMYDVRRYITLTGENGTFIPLEAEKWLKDRASDENSTYLIHFSPISYGWTAAKWLSWYPDVRVEINGVPALSTNISKYMWQSGWFDQHNRILNSCALMENTTPLFVCGDMHTQAAGMIVKSGELDFSSDPIASLLTGSLGVDGGGFPSGGIRAIEAMPPTDLEVIENLSSYEKAGFVLMDITPENISAKFYGWRYGQDDPSIIDSLTDHFYFEIPSKI